MKKLGKKLIAGTALAVTAAATAGCGAHPAVYGPPEYFETESETNIQSETTTSENYNPETDIPEAVYGPPEWFEPGSNIPEDVYGPQEYFENQN